MPPQSPAQSLALNIPALRAAYGSGELAPVQVMEQVLAHIEAQGDDHRWILRRPATTILDEARALEHRPRDLPLWGVPFAVKDNYDVAGLPTTAACPAYSYLPSETAPTVQALLDAGAILIGKTNLDQFATGLAGVRSPHGVARNAFAPHHVPGGSSAGSAAVVGAGLVSFALGSDTAGSGRVPAGFNNVVGIKPTLGYLSARGMIPACRSIDTASVFALSVEEGMEITRLMAGFDPGDAYSRQAPAWFSRALPDPELLTQRGSFRFAVPARDQRKFFGNTEYERLYDQAIARVEARGGQAVEIDFAPWVEAGDQLYAHRFAERVADLGAFIKSHPGDVLPVITKALTPAFSQDAPGAFKALHRLAALAQMIRPVWQWADFLLVPTAGTCWTIAELEEDPMSRNAQLGYYVNFVNMLDQAAIAVPSGFTPDGVPFGVCLVGPAWSDGRLAGHASAFHAAMLASGAEIG